MGLCAYNAGLGNCIKAQSLCDGAILWPDIAPCMGRVTGRHADETIGYVTMIHKWHAMMEASP